MTDNCGCLNQWHILPNLKSKFGIRRIHYLCGIELQISYDTLWKQNRTVDNVGTVSIDNHRWRLNQIQEIKFNDISGPCSTNCQLRAHLRLKVRLKTFCSIIQGVPYWRVPFKLTLTDSNEQVRFYFKVVKPVFMKPIGPEDGTLNFNWF